MKNLGQVQPNDSTVIQGEDQRLESRVASRGQDPPEIPGYELTHCLGKGSFGEVWSGQRLRTGQPVAVKILSSAAKGLESLGHELERLREVSQHSHIVGLVDADLSNDPPFLAMLRLPRTLQQATPIGREQALQWFEELLLALDYTHRKGLLHCDIKPSNLLIDEDNRLCLADFGQSRFLSGTQGGAWGTLGWMAPEQARLESSPNVSWDIYAAGAVAYWMLSGTCPRPLKQPELASYASQLGSTPLLELSKVDRDLNDIVTGCLALDPEKRPRSVSEILDDLQRRRQRLPLLCRRPWSPIYLATRALQRPAVVVPLLLGILLLSSLVWANQSLRALNQRLSETLRKENQVTASLLFEKGLAIEETQPSLARLWWLEALRRSPQDFVYRYRLLPPPLEHPSEQKIAWKWQGWEPQWTSQGLALKSIGSLGDRLLLWKVESNQVASLEVPGSLQYLADDGNLCDQRWFDKSHRLYQIDKKVCRRPLSGAVLAWRGGRMLVEAPDGGATLETVEGKILKRISEAVEEAHFSPDGSAFLLDHGDRCSLHGQKATEIPQIDELRTPLWTGSEVILWNLEGCQLWNWRTHKMLRSIRFNSTTYQVARSQDGGRLATWNGEEVIVSSFPQMKALARWKMASLKQLRFGQKDRTVLVSGTAGIQLYDSTTGQAISHPIAGPTAWADFGLDSRYLIDIQDGRAKAWKLPDPSLICEVPRYRPSAYQEEPWEKLAGAAFTGQQGQIVIVPDLSTLEKQSDYLRVLEEDGTLSRVADPPRAWVDQGRCLISLGPKGKLQAQALSCAGLESDHEFPASAALSTPLAAIFHQQQGIGLLREGNLSPLGLRKASRLALRPDGSQLVVAVDGRVDLYRLENSQAIPMSHWWTQQKVKRLFWLGERVLSLTSEGTYCHNQEGKELFRLSDPTLAVAPDGGSFCTRKGHQLTLHHPDGGRIAARDHCDIPLYSPDGSVLAVKSGRNQLLLLEATSLRPLSVPLQHQGEIVSLAFDAKSQRVLVCTERGELRQWPVGHPGRETFSHIEARTRLLCPGSLDPYTGTFLPP